MNRDELNEIIRVAKGGEPVDDRDRFFIKVSPRDYFILHRQFFPNMELPGFHTYIQQGYIAVEPDTLLKDGDVRIEID